MSSRKCSHTVRRKSYAYCDSFKHCCTNLLDLFIWAKKKNRAELFFWRKKNWFFFCLKPIMKWHNRRCFELSAYGPGAKIELKAHFDRSILGYGKNVNVFNCVKIVHKYAFVNVNQLTSFHGKYAERCPQRLFFKQKKKRTSNDESCYKPIFCSYFTHSRFT